ncbi:MAG TPA: hypothetical protein VJH22_06710 [Candidatus Nanoarchaeia archaeon]|nr:hypothetical protein [Candidatus Nanoarchaeia archaeon]
MAKKNKNKVAHRPMKKAVSKKTKKISKAHKPTPKHHKVHKSPERKASPPRTVHSRSKHALRSCSICGYRMLHLHERCPMCKKCSVCKKPLSECVCYEGQ